MSPITTFFRHHLGASVAGGVTVLALAGGSIAYAATSSGSSPSAHASRPRTNVATTTPSGGAAGGTGKGHKAKHPGVRGTITAVNGDAWTVKTAKGATLMVTITAQTAFGSPKAPSSASSFPLGATVRVVGQRTGTSITATRILAPATPGTTPGAGGSGTTGGAGTTVPSHSPT
ncbi:MAG: DUF5666 domain-containing protein [Actinomycetota bacterium]|nr:DUF5666 domain-containing protein [Actinomycetota bacterium]